MRTAASLSSREIAYVRAGGRNRSKIAQPLVARDIAYSELRYSDNSLSAFRNNIFSLAGVYIGRRTAPGTGVGALMHVLDPAGDREIRRAFDSAIASLDAVQPSFGKVLVSSPAKIEAAQRTVLRPSEVLGRRRGAVTGAVDSGT